MKDLETVSLPQPPQDIPELLEDTFENVGIRVWWTKSLCASIMWLWFSLRWNTTSNYLEGVLIA